MLSVKYVVPFLRRWFCIIEIENKFLLNQSISITMFETYIKHGLRVFTNGLD